jgi:hypothetical protein
MPTAPLVRQVQLLPAAVGVVVGSFALPPLPGSLLLAVTELANPSSWLPPNSATQVDEWRVLGATGEVGGMGQRVLWRTAGPAEPATYRIRVKASATGGAVHLVEVVGGVPHWLGGAAGELTAENGLNPAIATVTSAFPLVPPLSGPSLLLSFWQAAASAGNLTTPGISAGTGWTELIESGGGACRLQVQTRAAGVGSYPVEATFAWSSGALARGVVAVAVLAADDAAVGGLKDLNRWSRGQAAPFVRDEPNLYLELARPVTVTAGVSTIAAQTMANPLAPVAITATTTATLLTTNVRRNRLFDIVSGRFPINATAGTMTLTRTPAAGDLLVAAISLYPTAGVGVPAITPPAGWTLAADAGGTASNQAHAALYYRRWQSGDPLAFVWTFSPATTVANQNWWWVTAWSGVDAVTPLDCASVSYDSAGVGAGAMPMTIAPATPWATFVVVGVGWNTFVAQGGEASVLVDTGGGPTGNFVNVGYGRVRTGGTLALSASSGATNRAAAVLVLRPADGGAAPPTNRWFVRPDGSDANAGTSPAAGDAWRSLQKVLGASAPCDVVGGDTVYLAPGVYREARIDHQVGTIAGSLGADLALLGDPTAARFPDLAPGDVLWTPYTSAAADVTGSAPLVSLLFGVLNHVVVVDLRFEGGLASGAGSVPSIFELLWSQDLTFRRCLFTPALTTPIAAAALVLFNALPAGHRLGVLFDRCVFATLTQAAVQADTTNQATSYDLELTLRECLIVQLQGSSGTGDAAVVLNLLPTGAVTGGAGGLRLQRCTLLLTGQVAAITSTSPAGQLQAKPVQVLSCLVAGFRAYQFTSSVFPAVDDGTVWWTLVDPYATNADNAGPASAVGNARPPLLEVGQSALFGRAPRPPFMPLAGSPLLDAGAGLATALTTGMPATAANDAGTGTLAWTSPGNVLLSDGVKASVANVTTTVFSNWLTATGFGLAVPGDATVLGIRFDVELAAPANLARLHAVRAVKAGVIGSVAPAFMQTTVVGASDTGQVSGGAAELWGTTWTPAEVNAAGFGVAVSVQGSTGSLTTATIDAIRAVVYYRTPAVPADLLGAARPASGVALAVGAYDRNDGLVAESAVYRTSPPSGKLVGPSYQDFDVPVPVAGSKSVSVWARYDGSYAGPKPSLTILASGALGLAADATATMTGPADTWEQLTVTVQPARAGVLKARVRNAGTAAAGVAYFDDFAP